MEGSEREEGCRNLWKYRATGQTKPALDFEVFHILGGPDLQNVLQSAKIKVKLNHGRGEAGPPGRPAGGSVRKED